jgi:3'-phosphoadenosine 5'-phosphosulfate sulfotransferase (PAPS reductase)/FAD synthetase
MSTSDSSVSETSEEQWSRSYALIDSLLHSHTSPLSSFQKKLKKAVAVLENTLRLYLPDRVTHTHTLTHTLTHDDGNGTSVSVSDGKSPVFVSFNGGKDATVVLHLLRYVLHKHNLTALLGTAIKIIYFDDPHQFPEIEEFIRHTLTALRVEPVTFKCSFKEGIERAIDEYGLKAVLMGVRMGDPYTDDAEHFHPSTANYPAFMRVYPVLQWEYADGKTPADTSICI